MRPAYMTAMRSQICETTPKSWVMNNTAASRSRRRSSSSRSTCDCTVTSSAVVGSSGDDQLWVVGQRHGDRNALAQPPGERVRISLRALRGVGNAHAVHQIARFGVGFAARQRLMRANGFGDLVADGEQRMQRRQRVLEHMGDGPAAQGADAGVGSVRGGLSP